MAKDTTHLIVLLYGLARKRDYLASAKTNIEDYLNDRPHTNFDPMYRLIKKHG